MDEKEAEARPLMGTIFLVVKLIYICTIAAKGTNTHFTKRPFNMYQPKVGETFAL